MAITAFTGISLDKTEYSPYYRSFTSGSDYNLLTATITATGVDGDTVYVTLLNQDNGRPVAVKTTTLAAGQATAIFDIRHDSVDLDGVFRAKLGRYAIVAATMPLMTGVTYTSTSFPISPVPSIEIKETWLGGISLTNEQNFFPTTQGISGVVGVSTSDVVRGGYPLTWLVADRTLSFDGGPVATIPSTGPATQITLWGPTLDQTATFTVTPAAMPSTDTTGYVMVDYGKFDDSSLQHKIAFAISNLENQLGIPVEPTQAVTDLLKLAYPYFDRIVYPATYHPPASAPRPFRFQTSCRHVEVLHQVGGYYGETQVLSVPTQVVSIDRDNGFIELVPSINAQFPAPTVAGFGIFALYGMPYMGLPSVVPKFWQYALTYGLENMDTAAYGPLVREFIARTAAIDLLLLLGRAKIGILAAESFSRDGGSISRSYSNGQYGLYSDLILSHMQWLQTTGASLRRKLAGIVVSVSGL
jgi:hypothetical protein